MQPLDYNQLTSFEALYKAHKVARCGKRHKWDVINFESKLSENLVELESDLKSNTYKVGKYKTFKVYEPKERLIQALGYKDRIVQHTLSDNFLMPCYDKRLIYANCACRIGKGTFFARSLLKRYFIEFLKRHNSGYILKCDIHKYFPSIDHNELYKVIDKIKDKKIVNLLHVIIDSYNFDTGVGLPIGNQVSQIMGIVFLDKLDRVIKEKLRVKYYVRYMDDLIILHHDKQFLKDVLKEINNTLSTLKLKLNKKTQILTLSQGVEFLGAKFVVYGKKVIQRLKKQSKYKLIKNRKLYLTLHKKGVISNEYLLSARAGIKGHTKGFNCHRLLPKIMP